MKKELNKEKKVNPFLQALKRIFIDNPENVGGEIPGLDKIIPENEEEAKLIEELKLSQEKIYNSFREGLKVKPVKLELLNKENKKEKTIYHEKQNKDNISKERDD